AKIRAEIDASRKIVLEAGGLFVLGSERHESRRIDNQLRGRSGRQGDPGESKFFLSLQDDLMRIFGMEKLNPILKTLRIKTGEAITHRWVSGALAKAQAKVEAHHFEIRKNLLKFDNVMNEQRKIIYDLRKDMMTSADVSTNISEMRQIMVEELVAKYASSRMNEDWDLEGLSKELSRTFNIMLPLNDLTEDLAGAIYKVVEEKFADKEARFTSEMMRMVEKSVVLQTLDQVWKEHLQSLDYMRHSIVLRAYGQKDPLNEYKKETFLAFKNMLDVFRQRAVQTLSFVEIMPGADISGDYDDMGGAPMMLPGSVDKVGRNEKCPCGSGRKYKHCHGSI
ncbi:MAG: SEC-C metal-binding domain-containing protein, partial [Alphaproteobacteria bacterium]|nr:SEC-C metal-binding domain-containing protein [Alphaproteobacteria bacterium]